MAVAVEPFGPSTSFSENYPQDSESIAQRRKRIHDAITTLQGLGLRPVIYTSRAFWRMLTGGATTFSAIPLWDTRDDYLADLQNDCLDPNPSIGYCSVTASWVPYGGWSYRIGKQYNSGPSGNGTRLFGVDLDLDIFDQSLLP
jgi:hypothetical protein